MSLGRTRVMAYKKSELGKSGREAGRENLKSNP